MEISKDYVKSVQIYQQRPQNDVVLVSFNFEHISHIALALLLLNLNK